MSMKALSPLLALLVCALAQPATAKLTPQAPVDQPLTFSWKLNWDGRFEMAALGPKLDYWVPVFSIVSLDGGADANDLDVELWHRGIGPKEAEGINHNDSAVYHFKLNNVLTNLVGPPGATQNVPNSLQEVVHTGKGVTHHDQVRIEFKRIGPSIDFEVIARHVGQVPEPATWGLLAAGLATLGVARRRRSI